MPLSQKSVPLQALPSSWPAQSLFWLHAQVLVPALQLPAAHVSLWVHGLPSSQLAVLLAWTPPALLSQLSVVHGLPSSQKLLATALPLHTPLVHS